MSESKSSNRFFLILIIYQIVASYMLSATVYLWDIRWDICTLQIVFQTISFLPPIVLYFIITRRPLASVLPHKNPGLVNIILIVCMSIAIQPFAMFLSAISSIFFGNRISTMMEDMYSLPAATVLFTIAVVPAIYEELVFRGIVLSNYKSLGIKTAALASGLFFGIMHMDYQQFLYAFALGVFLANLVHYTESIYSAILAHFTINASQTILGLIFQSTGMPEESSPVDLAMALYTILPLLMITMPIFAVLFHIFKSRNSASGHMPLSIKKIITWEGLAAIILFFFFATS